MFTPVLLGEIAEVPMREPGADCKGAPGTPPLTARPWSNYLDVQESDPNLGAFRKLQVGNRGVQYLPRHVEPHKTSLRLGVHCFRIPLQDTGPLGGQPRPFPGEVWGHPCPALRVRCCHVSSVATPQSSESRGMSEMIFWPWDGWGETGAPRPRFRPRWLERGTCGTISGAGPTLR